MSLFCAPAATLISPLLSNGLQGKKDLLKYGQLSHFVDAIMQTKCSNDSEILELKAAIWILAHTSTSTIGIEHLHDCAPQIFEKIIHLVKYCDIYSVRATALHALGLIGTTKTGADILFKYGNYSFGLISWTYARISCIRNSL